MLCFLASLLFMEYLAEHFPPPQAPRSDRCRLDAWTGDTIMET